MSERPTVAELRAKVTPDVKRFEIPAGTPMANCRSCEALVYWITTETQARMQVDTEVVDGRRPDDLTVGTGVAHFVTCPDSRMWSKRKGGRGR